MIDPMAFRDVLARFASGVTVVTAKRLQGYHGVTVTAFCSLSLNPPLVLICLDKEIQSHDIVATSPGFVINILAREQEFLAEQFSGRAPLADPQFSRVPHRLGVLGIPLIDGCLAWIECRHWAQYEGGDHTIFVGEVVALERGRADDPLVYFDRQFHDLAWD
jgi:flavin reductase (DIM6/NTAB) family NADH-FMN oxidoreductase RutF